MKKIMLLTIATLLFSCATTLALAKEKWTGVDESVVGKFARELGREPQEPLINTDQGDMLLFVFTLAGAIGGFIVGYQWHKLFVAGRVTIEELEAMEKDNDESRGEKV